MKDITDKLLNDGGNDGRSLALLPEHTPKGPLDSRGPATFPHPPAPVTFVGLMAQIQSCNRYNPSEFSLELLKQYMRDIMNRKPPKK